MIDKHIMHFFVKEAFIGKARKAVGDFVGNLTGSRYKKALEKAKKLQRKAWEIDDQLDAAVEQKLKQGTDMLRADTVRYSDEMEPLRRRVFRAERAADDAMREATRIGESTAKTQQAAMIAGLGTVGAAGIGGGVYAVKKRKSKEEQ